MQWLTSLEEFFTAEMIAVITASSLFMFVASAVVTPWVLVKLPDDYFKKERRHLIERLREASTPMCFYLVGKNFMGVLLFLVGVLMLVLPGQGLLTIIMSLILIDFPHKQQLERRLVCRPRVLRTVNWIRQRYGRKKLDL